MPPLSSARSLTSSVRDRTKPFGLAVVASRRARIAPRSIATASALGTIALLVCATLATGVTSAADNWAADPEPVVVGRSATSEVSIGASRDGSVIAVAWAREDEGTRAIDVVASVDGGATYGPQVMVGAGIENPTVFVLDDGTIVISALSASDPVAPYWPVLYRSIDSGRSFASAGDLHAVFGEQTSRETTPSVAMSSDGQRIVVAWHEHSHHDGSHSASPVTATLSNDGGATWSPATHIAPASCHCCAISAFALADTVGVGFRAQIDVDEASDERDPAFVLADATGTFGAVQEVHDDHWVMERSGCPSSGPRFATDGTALDAVWWTGAGDVLTWQISRRGADGRFGPPDPLVPPDGDPFSLDSQYFAAAVGPGGRLWILAAAFPVGATGYHTVLWEATDDSPPAVVPAGEHPYAFTRAGLDVAAVPDGAVIAFHGEDEVLVQRISG